MAVHIMLMMTRVSVVTLVMFCVSSLPIRKTDSNSKTAVTVREVSVEKLGQMSIISLGMPAKKMLRFELNGEEVELDLQLNSLIRDDVNVYMTENGVTKLMKKSKNEKEVYGYYQEEKTNATVMVKCDRLEWRCQPVGTFMLNGKIYQLETTGSLPEATHFVTEIHRDDRDAYMHGDAQQIPEYHQSSGQNIGNKNKNAGTNENRGRVKRAIPAGFENGTIKLYASYDERNVAIEEPG